MFDHINILDEHGVSARCVSDQTPLSELLLHSVQYHDPCYYVISGDDKTWLGTIRPKSLAALAAKGEITPDTPLGEICAKLPDQVSFWCDPQQPVEPLEAVAKVFNDFPGMRELPVTDPSGRLFAIVSKARLFALYGNVRPHPTEPVNLWSADKHYESSPNGLNAYARNVHSQHGEDGILEELFRRIGMTNRYAVEFGGWDGIHLSNIRNLLVSHGFSGLFIEGDADKSAQCAKNYADHPNVHCATGFVGFLNNKKLDAFLSEDGAPQAPDLVSIDIDGYDYHVWDALTEHRPRVVLIEYNPTIPNDIIFISPKSERIFTGSSISAMVFLAHRKGYSLAAVTQTNCIFVVDEEFGKLEILDNSIDALRWDALMHDGKYYQAFDERLYYLGGMSFFVWSGKRFASNTLRVPTLP